MTREARWEKKKKEMAREQMKSLKLPMATSILLVYCYYLRSHGAISLSTDYNRTWRANFPYLFPPPPIPEIKDIQLGLTRTSLEHSVEPGNEKISTSVAYFTNGQPPKMQYLPRYNNLGGGSRPVYIN